MIIPRIQWLPAILDSGFFSFAYDRSLMGCACWRDTRRERWLESQNSSFECIKRKPFWHRQEAKREKTGIGDRIFIVHWSPALIHIKLLSSTKNDTVLCLYLKLQDPFKLHNYLKIKLIVHYLYFNILLGVSYHFFIASYPLGVWSRPYAKALFVIHCVCECAINITI